MLAHNKPAKKVIKELDSYTEGLSEDSVKQRQQRYGLNKIEESAGESILIRFFRQFKSIVIGVLIIAALLSTVIGEYLESAGILAIVIINGVLGFVQESRAEHALAALKKLSRPMSKVFRDGSKCIVESTLLVPGDIIELEAGDVIPADARLVSAYGLRTQEATLTGESSAVHKDANKIIEKKAGIADQFNMVFSGTIALAGVATAIVTQTGMNTEMGKIAGMLAHQPHESTPLQRRLAELGRALLYICVGIVLIISILQLLRGEQLANVIVFAVSLAVAAVPEGLPAVVTIALAYGVTRMAARNALIRRLPCVETLGSVNTICSDKTGTLTRNEMTVTRITAGGKTYHVGGSGYQTKGKFSVDGSETAIDVNDHPALKQTLITGARCNHAKLVQRRGNNQVIGDPTEGALLVAAIKAGIDYSEHELLNEIPFDSDRKMMSVVSADPAGEVILYCKGAPEIILERCTHIKTQDDIRPLNETDRKRLMADCKSMAVDALRLLGLAYRTLEQTARNSPIESELTFIGIVGMIDPPRPEVYEAVKKCRQAGIRPIMITGDHPSTGLAIARELKIANDNGTALTGEDINNCNDYELAHKLKTTSVFARVSPSHKLRIVNILKQQDQVVAMTGDGVNDAPAIQAADIGIAMGLTGSDVTKEASAMILTDDNFASIVNAVEEGRGIYSNIQKTVLFLLAGNSSEILLVLISTLMGWPTPLTATQILWINLVTDGLPALSLVTESPEKGAMKQPPKPIKEPFFNRDRAIHILSHGVFLAAASLAGYWWTLNNGETSGGNNIVHTRGVAFTICAFSQLAYSLSCRSTKRTFIQLGLFSNKALLMAVSISITLQTCLVLIPDVQPFFFSEGINFDAKTWLFIAITSLIPLTGVETLKLIKSKIAGGP